MKGNLWLTTYAVIPICETLQFSLLNIGKIDFCQSQEKKIANSDFTTHSIFAKQVTLSQNDFPMRISNKGNIYADHKHKFQ